ncbi:MULTISPECIES: xanthine dehydrogenase family protein molybdopterin-binding subunit [unclassified Colwellia]|jgi:isoquinoline 1-oxidoreductase beta subunit|uniref:xanthine dehydrogenase family protein molybdopterin-binding subunit n=1 Tax=unclassified Colwellia TaxID=196834 RepID=UPI0015F4C432|nr:MULTISPECIES: molybdopterin cofactor-binding domain-containing protein [unclassified Colwellia]MBA6253220.1 xanthine dehydrogenase family protein molybdopterin-binding subunit [Colwellia sp. MB3u-55]MBA6399577.1 xanthine dehydrogenase family protein molybdopterin-binding subunit [Colwellia sp. BRX10-4]
MSITRRMFVFGGAAIGGGLALGVIGLGTHLAMHDRLGVQRDGNTKDTLLNLWLRINKDNTVTLLSPHTELGQGAGTGLTQIVADELDLDWQQIKLELAPATTAFSNGGVFEGFVSEMIGKPPAWAEHIASNAFNRLADLLNMQMTGGSASIRFTGWQVMREAAAAARQMLINAAIDKYGASTNTTTDAGYVVDGDNRWSYGELVEYAATLDVPENYTLRAKGDRKFIGKAMPRHDLPDKIFLETQYGIDRHVEGMRYAAIAHSGVFGANVATIDNLVEITSMRGVLGVENMGLSVAVIANNPWRAEQAIKALKITAASHKNSDLSSASIETFQRESLQGELSDAHNIGDVASVLGGSGETVEAEFWVPYLAHATMEPMNASAWFEGDKLHVAAGVQNPLYARVHAAKVANMDVEDVVFHAHSMGGGFGRRVGFSMSEDNPIMWIDEVVTLVKKYKFPIKLTWSREADTRQDVYRPAVLAKFSAQLDENAKPRYWLSASYGSEGGAPASMPPYNVDNIKVQFANHPSPVPIGFWRSVENSQHAFFNESFIDILAKKAQVDPIKYRLALLDNNDDHAKCLKEVAQLCNWQYGVSSDGKAMGVAVQKSFGTMVATVAEVSLQNNQACVHRVWIVTDSGVVVNPDSAIAQVEGGVLFGLTAALYGRCDIESGGVKQSNFHDYPIIKMAEAPIVQVKLLESANEPGGFGEVGVPTIAPAVANALAVLGKRPMRLPINA